MSDKMDKSGISGEFDGVDQFPTYSLGAGFATRAERLDPAKEPNSLVHSA